MARQQSPQLPIHPAHLDDGIQDETPACSPKIYVSNEEASLLRQLRELRERAVTLRRELAAAEPSRRSELERQMDDLRALRRDIVHRREAAFRRKMIMLGHLPPDAADDELTL
jgi:hypothetical protein